ncbi:alpha/beta hydrolase family protein [Halobacillus sp. A5]|uniref:alpha/beta hydrolase n=1 Tax=Halobacillus sp. A5 TaxID=2880263 RepID=UPI0021128F80|nr:alpha/beta hydrolase family protein [Halobacillus sp. A5]
MDLDVSMNVLIPEHRKNTEKKLPALYLLHGLSDDHSKWLRYTSIERYVEERELAVIMPAADRSFYTNMVNGHSYFTYIAEEVPEVARTIFPLSRNREDNYTAGLSMGGYGALKIALSYPERFAAAASLSGSVDVESRRNAFPQDFKNIFGDQRIKGSRNDLFYLADQLTRQNGFIPKLYLACGTEDHNVQANTRLVDYMSELGLPITYEKGPGAHDWKYWDKQIQRILGFLEF